MPQEKKKNKIIQEISDKYQYCQKLVQRFVSNFGLNETLKLIKGYEKEPLQGIRVNTLKISKRDLKKRLSKKEFILKECKWSNAGLIIKGGKYPLGATTEYLAGYYFIQSPASLLPVEILNPQPGDFIIDCAAAPGGKATHIAQKMKSKGTLLCIDISRERMKSLRANVNRCGITNVICVRRDFKKFANTNLKADKILCDAPCSGEGLLAIDKERRKKVALNDIRRLAQLQKELIQTAVSLLKKEGILVYSTCSTAVEENEEVINWALQEFPLKIEETGFREFSKGHIKLPEKTYNTDLEKAIRLYPQKHQTEGFFICKMRFIGDKT
ncbi:MAG: RsmB/NOP family class I SAM-dependent RNA methyltransferase [Asgard group archaeon]|nr:RsmB/NOP family class I SAM-dependent RNA methyltransferase [Asgard group archaeon]